MYTKQAEIMVSYSVLFSYKNISHWKKVADIIVSMTRK